jgi:hypothetical protein
MFGIDGSWFLLGGSVLEYKILQFGAVGVKPVAAIVWRALSLL